MCCVVFGERGRLRASRRAAFAAGSGFAEQGAQSSRVGVVACSPPAGGSIGWSKVVYTSYWSKVVYPSLKWALRAVSAARKHGEPTLYRTVDFEPVYATRVNLEPTCCTSKYRSRLTLTIGL